MIALTMGDPAGIGGEITRAAWTALRHTGPAFMAIDDPSRLATGATVPVREVLTAREAALVFPDALPVMRVDLRQPAIAGRPNPANAPSIIASIEHAVRLALDGDVTAMVTNPIAKSVLYEAGFAHPGHTEFLAALTGGGRPVMMLANDHLRVVPVTIHVSLRDALDQLDTGSIIETARITSHALRSQFGIARPRLAIAGLNPHAGEQGAMGDEEARVIQPAIDGLRNEGLAVTGPHPPDTMFTPAARARYDVAICMYHDQALIPLKTLDVSSGVNITLGLPIIRTSPDHGTAFDIAGHGTADPSSLIAALRLAAHLSESHA